MIFNLHMPDIRSKNKQLAINMTASFVTFLVGMGISFLLTPYIVGHLGAAAYGFVGLSNNIVSYTTLFTIALNSMAGRFITISYTQGKIDEANKYFSSVFYSNLILSGMIFLIMGCFVFYLEKIFDIPDELKTDVKLLFAILVFNSILGLLTNVYAIATFIKNRLELSSLRQIVGNILRTVSIILLFSCFSPRLWYIGAAGMIVTLYTAFTNFRYTKVLTPELCVSNKNFDWEKVKELLSSGAWNVLSKVGNILGTGLDLVFANLFVGATAMGYFSISKTIPVHILGVFAMISAVFAPVFTNLYALDKRNELLSELNKSIRILGFFTTIPLACLYVLGSSFYKLWLPGEDCYLLQNLTLVGTLGLSFAMPLEALHNIFTITNKLKYPAMVDLINNVMVFLIVLISMFVVESELYRLLILAGTRTCTGILRVIIFLPLYGAHCLNENKTVFYSAIVKSVSGVLITTILGYFATSFININSWFSFIGSCLIIALIGILFNYTIVLKKQDREFIKIKIMKIRK